MMILTRISYASCYIYSYMIISYHISSSFGFYLSSSTSSSWTTAFHNNNNDHHHVISNQKRRRTTSSSSSSTYMMMMMMTTGGMSSTITSRTLRRSRSSSSTLGMTIWYSTDQPVSNYIPQNSRRHRNRHNYQQGNSNNNDNMNNYRIHNNDINNDNNYYFDDDDVNHHHLDHIDINNNHDILLSYLPDHGNSIPPQTKLLIQHATTNYIQQREQQHSEITNNNQFILSSYHDIAIMIENEYITRDVPVIIHDISNNNHNNTVLLQFDVTNTGQEIDETIAEILSLCAIHTIPIDIVIQILYSISYDNEDQLGIINHNKQNVNTTITTASYQTKIHELICILKQYGWKSITFPNGLAVIKPKQKIYQNYLSIIHQLHNVIGDTINNKKNWLSISQFQQHLHEQKMKHLADNLIRISNHVLPPPRRLLGLSRYEFLMSLEEQMRNTNNDNNNNIGNPIIRTATSSSSSSTLRDANKQNIQNRMTTTTYPTVSSLSSSSSSLPVATIASSLSEKDSNQKEISASLSVNNVHDHDHHKKLLFFPNSIESPMSNIRLKFRRMKRYMKRLYTTLKEQGRSGLLAYCFFNFIYYSIGMIWQWNRMASASTTDIIPMLLSSTSSSMFESIITSSTSLSTSSLPFHFNYIIIKQCLLKFSKVFALIFALSPIFKIPAMITSITLSPIISKLLKYTKKMIPYNISETKISLLYISILLLLWISIISIPFIYDYTILFNIMKQYYNDELMMTMYGSIFQLV